MFYRRILDYLKNWQNKETRKPLILRGGRQVGKTSAVQSFAQDNFENAVIINLEKADVLAFFKKDLSLADFEKIVQIKFKQKIISGKTLIFLDEIQNSPALIKLLRFFYEEKPDWHVIGAGSLLEAKLKTDGLSLPVGRIEYAYLYPMDFFEYLEAKQEIDMLAMLKNLRFGEKIHDSLHQEALKNFYEYAMIGGMPEIVKTYLEGNDFQELQNIYSSLLTAYTEDIYKYTSQANAKYLAYVLEQAPLFAGTSITYEKFGGGNFKSREMSMAFYFLQKVMLLYQAQATKSIDLPLIAQKKRPKKLLSLDIGLVNHQSGIQEEFLNLKDLNSFYRGRIAEQVVGQNIIAQFIDIPAKLFYWASEKPSGSAEVDFCLNHQGKIYGIEVKSGASNRLRSLFRFAKLTKKHKLIRISNEPLKQEKIAIGNKGFDLISLPFYLIPRILDF
ncbi:MAG: AAA family ATPase [bacterium]